MKQRDEVVMTEPEVHDFLASQRNATVGTLGPRGQIALVGMWFALFDGHLWFETKPKSQKVVNLRRDPRMSFLVEAGQTYDTLRGVAMEGQGVVIDDADLLERVCLGMFERYQGPYTPEMRPYLELMMHNRVVIRLDVERTRSWDHRKLGLPPMELGGTTAAAAGGR